MICYTLEEGINAEIFNNGGSVQWLNFTGNNIWGTSPLKLFRGLKHPTRLDFSKDSIKGKMTKDIGNIKYLKTMRLERNYMEGGDKKICWEAAIV